MLSVITVVSMPSRVSSHAVSRAPWRNGRVSSANTAHLLALLDRAANHAERRAVAGRRQRAGVAVRQHARRSGTTLGAMRAHRAAARDIFVVNRARLGFEPLLDLIDRLARRRRLGKHALHAIDRPEQIDRGRPRGRHHLAQLVELGRELRACRSPCSAARRARAPSPPPRQSPARRESPSS